MKWVFRGVKVVATVLMGSAVVLSVGAARDLHSPGFALLAGFLGILTLLIWGL